MGDASEQLGQHFAAWELMDRRSGPAQQRRAWLTATSRERYLRLVRGTLEPLRETTGALGVVSGERRESKTAANSRHMPPECRPDARHRATPDGRTDAAADVRSRTLSPLAVATAALRLMGQGVIPVGGVGMYPTFAHVDNRGRVAVWRGQGVDDATWALLCAARDAAASAIRTRMEVGT